MKQERAGARPQGPKARQSPQRTNSRDVRWYLMQKAPCGQRDGLEGEAGAGGQEETKAVVSRC